MYLFLSHQCRGCFWDWLNLWNSWTTLPISPCTSHLLISPVVRLCWSTILFKSRFVFSLWSWLLCMLVSCSLFSCNHPCHSFLISHIYRSRFFVLGFIFVATTQRHRVFGQYKLCWSPVKTNNIILDCLAPFCLMTCLNPRSLHVVLAFE